MKAAFSVEISNDIPLHTKDWNEYRPFKFLCGSIKFSNEDVGYRTFQTAQSMLDYLLLFCDSNMYSWNGLGFGFAVLADSVNRPFLCSQFAKNHTDMMFDFFCRHGYPISLMSVAKGFGFDKEVEAIIFRNNNVADWAKRGQNDLIEELSRMKADLILRVVEKAEDSGGLVWINGRGERAMETIDHFHPVHEAILLPEPDVSWMSDPMSRESFTKWQQTV